MTPAIEIVPGPAYHKPQDLIPGEREPGMLTTFGTHSASVNIVPAGPSTMDAATILERQREGGGAPSQRRLPRARTRWNDWLPVRAWRLGTSHA